jgi:hypothetical protein
MSDSLESSDASTFDPYMFDAFVDFLLGPAEFPLEDATDPPAPGTLMDPSSVGVASYEQGSVATSFVTQVYGAVDTLDPYVFNGSPGANDYITSAVAGRGTPDGYIGSQYPWSFTDINVAPVDPSIYCSYVTPSVGNYLGVSTTYLCEESIISTRAHEDNLLGTFYRGTTDSIMSPVHGTGFRDFNRGNNVSWPSNEVMMDTSGTANTTVAPVIVTRECPEALSACVDGTIDRGYHDTPRPGTRGKNPPSKRQRTSHDGVSNRQKYEHAVEKYDGRMQAVTASAQQRYYSENYKRLLKLMPRPPRHRNTSIVQQQIARGRRRDDRGQFAARILYPNSECDIASIQDI